MKIYWLLTSIGYFIWFGFAKPNAALFRVTVEWGLVYEGIGILELKLGKIGKMK